MLLDLRRQSLDLDPERARALADRHLGIGCDQLLVLHEGAGGALARFEIWNADGSRAEQCGNGVRCIGRYLQMNGETTGEDFTLDGPAGPVRLRCLEDGRVRVALGRAVFEPASVPTTLEPREGLCELELEGGRVTLGVVSMGNPHAVLRVDDAEAAPIRDLGARIGADPAFPEGCNVGFAEVADRDTLRLRVFERGAGETLACGSGACAAAAHAHRMGWVGERVRVIQPGGLLIIDLAGDGEIHMTGPATHVFRGTMA
ncbi:MAG: diaminopimelate epimerase [Gammaproteobacteria bacterium]